MDVFFHIIDDRKYTSALRNIHAMLSDDGYFIFSENPVPTEAIRGHVRDRREQEILFHLRAAGFEVAVILPMFILMNPPVASTNRWLWKFSSLRTSALRWAFQKRMNWLGWIIGMLIYPAEKTLLMSWGWRRGPCTNIYVLRKAGRAILK